MKNPIAALRERRSDRLFWAHLEARAPQEVKKTQNRKALALEVVPRLDALYEQGWKDTDFNELRNDPRYGDALEAINSYAAVSICEWVKDEEGGQYPRPYVTDPQVATSATDQVIVAFDDLSQRFHPIAIKRALTEDTVTALQVDLPSGTDVDGFTHYEPYGRPHTHLTAAVADAELRQRFNRRSVEELELTKIALVDRQDYYGRADLHGSWKDTTHEIKIVDDLVSQRSAEVSTPVAVPTEPRPWTFRELLEPADLDDGSLSDPHTDSRALDRHEAVHDPDEGIGL